MTAGGSVRSRGRCGSIVGKPELGGGHPLLSGPQQRRYLARKLVVDGVLVAADTVRLGRGREERPTLLRQPHKIDGVLQPAVPPSPPGSAQPPDRRLVGFGHAVDVGGNLDADGPVVTRLVAGNLDPKSLVRHRGSLSSDGW